MRVGGGGVVSLVIDVGCASHGADQSIGPLIERFRPDRLIGMDPQVRPSEYTAYGTKVTLWQMAAWTHNGMVGFVGDNLGARVDETGTEVPCIDFPLWLVDQPVNSIVKMDCEGSEYALLERMYEIGADLPLQLLLVEWHCSWCGHGVWSHAESCENREASEARALRWEAKLRCPVERWEQ